MFDAISKRAFRGTRRSSWKGKFPKKSCLSLERLEDRRMLATVTVTTLAENPSLAIVDDGQITLREAIQYVNGDFLPIENGLDLAQIDGEFKRDDPTQDDKIIFESSVTGSIILTLGEIDIRREVEIEGPGAGSLTIDASGNFRIFDITSAAGDIATNQPKAQARERLAPESLACAF